MSTRLSAAAALVVAAAFVLTGIASAGHTAAHQRIAIVSSGNDRTFVLTPLTSGPVMRDSGTATSCCWTRRFVQRDGQSVEIDNPLRTFEGRQGTLAWRARITWVDLGNGHSVGTGTWKIVRGTGAYARIQGHGRIALITGASGHGPVRAEGLVDLRG
jgi:hypothetical protein